MSTATTSAERRQRATEGLLRLLLTALLTAFYGGWLLMLLLGVVASESGDPRWLVGYWTAVPVALGLRSLFACLCRSNRKYALPPDPTVRR